MAVTLIKKTTERPLCIHSDGTSCYVGTNRGRILKITISDGTTVVYARLANTKVTALTSDDSYLYVGDNKGRITRITINATYSLRVKSVLEANLHSPVVGIHHNTATRYLVLANGKVESRA